ncbi:MAG TPA: 50S ribosomal protein L35 [Deltaproteobacteria bacterium]|nr:50S ribosomal protein L35 [Deltaproteobacteria bacterium]
MPKIKTNRGAAKRLRVTKNKKFKFSKTKRRHILEGKSPKESRQMRAGTYVHKSDEGRMHQLLPYA